MDYFYFSYFPPVMQYKCEKSVSFEFHNNNTQLKVT